MEFERRRRRRRPVMNTNAMCTDKTARAMRESRRRQTRARAAEAFVRTIQTTTKYSKEGEKNTTFVLGISIRSHCEAGTAGNQNRTRERGVQDSACVYTSPPFLSPPVSPSWLCVAAQKRKECVDFVSRRASFYHRVSQNVYSNTSLF